MRNIAAAVELFNTRILGRHAPIFPTRLKPQEKEWAIGAFNEEVQEYSNAETIEDEADALADLAYYALGRLHCMGLDTGAIFSEVHRANMKKVPGVRGRRQGHIGEGFDAVKPEDWLEPVHTLEPARKTKLLVIGHARHGKDTVCEILRDQYDFSFMSSSRLCAEKVVYPLMRDKYASSEECFNDRSNHRAFWHNAIIDFLKEDMGKLGNLILSQYDIYCGIRALRELEACRRHADCVVWVDARKRLPLEPASSMQLEAHHADFIIDNNGTLEQLEDRVEKFVLGKY